MEPGFKSFPTDRSVRGFMDVWMASNGKADPRPMLDRYFWSHMHGRSYSGLDQFREVEGWCNDMLGEENWHRMFNKFWFTSEEHLVTFKLTWGLGNDAG